MSRKLEPPACFSPENVLEAPHELTTIGAGGLNGWGMLMPCTTSVDRARYIPEVYLMPKHKDQTIPVTLRLTPDQVEALLHQVTGAEEDWMDDPRILRMLAKRDCQVATEIRSGKFATLMELQARWTKRRAKAKKRPTS